AASCRKNRRVGTEFNDCAPRRAGRAFPRRPHHAGPPATIAVSRERSPSARQRQAHMIPQTPDRFQEIRDALRDLCAQFPDEYHRQVDADRAYPEEFVDALTKAGWLAALIPTEYGGSGLGLAEASVIMEEINRSGANAGDCDGQVCHVGRPLRDGSEEQERVYLPKIAWGGWRLQSRSVSEFITGTDTTEIRTTAVKKGDRYVVNGQ